MSDRNQQYHQLLKDKGMIIVRLTSSVAAGGSGTGIIREWNPDNNSWENSSKVITVWDAIGVVFPSQVTCFVTWHRQSKKWIITGSACG